MNDLMSTEPGGENTQYESIKTVTKESDKQSGQLGGSGGEPSSLSEDTGVSKEKGEKTAENMRYGQAISEQGVGGMTTTSSGEANQGGYGGAKADKDQEDLSQTRREQGYGGGSGVGG